MTNKVMAKLDDMAKLDRHSELDEALNELAKNIGNERRKFFYNFVAKELTNFIVDYYKNNKDNLSELDLEIEISTHLPLVIDKFDYYVEELNRHSMLERIDKILKEKENDKA